MPPTLFYMVYYKRCALLLYLKCQKGRPDAMCALTQPGGGSDFARALPTYYETLYLHTV